MKVIEEKSESEKIFDEFIDQYKGASRTELKQRLETLNKSVKGYLRTIEIDAIRTLLI